MELQLTIRLMVAHHFNTGGGAFQFQAPLQPIAVVEAKQEVEVPHSRAKARATRLSRHSPWSLQPNPGVAESPSKWPNQPRHRAGDLKGFGCLRPIAPPGFSPQRVAAA